MIFQEFKYRKNGNDYASYRCSCGTIKIVRVRHVENGSIRSCGCLRKKVSSNKATTHGMTKSPLYNTWICIKRRCYNKKHPQYPYYGGDGITMCDEWKNDFVSFMNWCIANGWRKGMQIDKDIKGGKQYSPSNCLLVTCRENNNNRRDSVMVDYNGKIQSTADWGRELGLDSRILSERIRKGWTVEKAFARWKPKPKKKTVA